MGAINTFYKRILLQNLKLQLHQRDRYLYSYNLNVLETNKALKRVLYSVLFGSPVHARTNLN